MLWLVLVGWRAPATPAGATPQYEPEPWREIETYPLYGATVTTEHWCDDPMGGITHTLTATMDLPATTLRYSLGTMRGFYSMAFVEPAGAARLQGNQLVWPHPQQGQVIAIHLTEGVCYHLQRLTFVRATWAVYLPQIQRSP